MELLELLINNTFRSIVRFNLIIMPLFLYNVLTTRNTFKVKSVYKLKNKNMKGIIFYYLLGFLLK